MSNSNNNKYGNIMNKIVWRRGLTGAGIDAQIVFGRNGQSFIGRLRRVQPVGAYLRRLLHRTVRQYE